MNHQRQQRQNVDARDGLEERHTVQIQLLQCHECTLASAKRLLIFSTVGKTASDDSTIATVTSASTLTIGVVLLAGSVVLHNACLKNMKDFETSLKKRSIAREHNLII